MLPVSTCIELRLMLDMGVRRPDASSPASDEADEPGRIPPAEGTVSAASGPGRSDDAVLPLPDTAVLVDVATLPLPAELAVLSERMDTGRDEAEAEATELARVAAVEDVVVERPRPNAEPATPPTTTVGLVMGEAARPEPSETDLAFEPAPPVVPPALSEPEPGGGAPRPKLPLTTRGFSPSRSKRERRLPRSAWGMAFCGEDEERLAFAAAPDSKAAMRDFREEVCCCCCCLAGEFEALPVPVPVLPGVSVEDMVVLSGELSTRGRCGR